MHLKDILRNRDKGAGELLRSAIVWLKQHPDSLNEIEIINVLHSLRTKRPAMVGFRVLADRLEKDLSTPSDLSDEEILQGIQSDIYQADVEVARRITALLSERGQSSVVTLSYSSSVVRALEASAEHISSLHVLESQPGAEGRRTQKAGAKFIKEVVLHMDDELKSMAEVADVGLIGADTVFADGSVINKVLSWKLAKALIDQGKPIYVLATSWKKSTQPGTDEHLKGEDRQLFELVPAELITQIVTEE